MREIGAVLPPLAGDVFTWLEQRGVKPAGPLFWRYFVVDMERKLEIDVAVPVAVALPGDGHIVADVLPAGPYVTALHVGSPDGLMQATAHLLAWAEHNGITWEMNGPRWGGRVEWYLDMSTWKTELAFLAVEDEGSERAGSRR